MPTPHRSSWKEKRDRITRTDFVGRHEQLASFRASVANPDSETIIFAISGQGGVGKTTLLKQFRQIAIDAGHIAAYVDEGSATNRVEDVPEALYRLAKDFEGQNANYKFEKFQERYKTYRQKRQELEADPEAPSGLAAGIGRVGTRFMLGGAKAIPGVSDVMDEFVNSDALVEKGGDLLSFAWKKFSNKDEVQLVTEPLEVLTPLFLDEINRIAERQTVVLLLDTYEITGKFLDDWLLAVLNDRYGDDLTGNFRLCIAGRDPLDRNAWATLESCIARSPLEPFTEDETRLFLHNKGIISEAVIAQIWKLSSDGLPLLVSMMAQNAPTNPDAVVDPCEDAVERFLKWETDNSKRQFAQDAAVPRVLNQDVVDVLGDGQFEWLKGCAFVVRDGERWRYHLVVREQMVRYQFQKSSKRWDEVHGKLAAYYDQKRQGLGLEAGKEAKDECWREWTLEWLYHNLCVTPQAKLDVALNGFLSALKASRVFAIEWAIVMAQAGEEAKCTALEQWGKRLRDGMIAQKEKRYQEAILALTSLLIEPCIAEKLKAVALDWRGCWYRSSNQEEAALQDLKQAVEIDKENAEYWADLAQTYKYFNRYEEAIACHHQAIAINPNVAYSHNGLGNIYKDQQRYEEAIISYQEAIALAPEWATPHSNLGSLYVDQKRYGEAITVYEQAINHDSKNGWAFAGRGLAYYLIGRYDKALKDYDKAIELNNGHVESIALRGAIYLELGRYSESMSDCIRALELDPNNSEIQAILGMIQYKLGNINASLKTFQRALELQPDDLSYASNLSYLHLLQGNIDKAQELIESAIKDQSFGRVWLNLGLIQALRGQLDAAKQSWQQGLSLMEDESDWEKAVRYVFTVALGNPTVGLEQMQNLINSGTDQFTLRNALNDATILSRTQQPIEGIELMIALLQTALDSMLT